MKKLLALAAIALLATSAFAQVDPDANGMAVYFDMEGTELCKTVVPVGPTNVPAYLLLTNIEGPQLLAWEAKIVVETNSLSPGQWALNGGLNALDGVENFAVGLGAAPPMAAPVILLATRTLLFFFETDYATFTVMGVPGSLSFPDGTPGFQAVLNVFTAGQSPTGSFSEPQSFINGDCQVVANQDMAWGAVKSLY